MRRRVKRTEPAVAPRPSRPYHPGWASGLIHIKLRMGTGAIISRGAAVAACGLFVSACSSWLPSMPSIDMSAFKSGPPTEQISFESEPPGAEVRTAAGTTCRTPCALGVPMSNGSVTVAMNGYMPQTVPVQVVTPNEGGRTDEFGAPSSHLAPNPVYVELQANPPPPPVAKKPAPAKKPRVAAIKPKPTTAQVMPATTGSTAPPPTTSMAPWPAAR
jgi:PEGA domain-containing protein